MSKKRRRTSGKVRKQKTNTQQIKLAIKQGNLDKAILLLQGAKGAVKDSKRFQALAELYFQRAHRYLTLHSKQAESDFKRAIDLRPNEALYRYHLALFYHRQGDLDRAITSYRAVLHQSPDFTRAILPLAFALQEQGQNVKKDAIWGQLTPEQQAIFTGDESLSNDLMKAVAAMQKQDWDTARKILQDVLTDKTQGDYTRGLAHDYLGRIALEVNSDELETAITHWRTAYQLGLKSDTLTDNLTLAYVLQIEATLANNETQRATEQVQEAIDLFPTHPRLQEIQAHLLLESGYQKALANDWEMALEQWEEIVNAEGELARRLTANMAIAYEKREDWEPAADSWREFARRRGRKEGAANWLSPAQVARLWSRISNLYMRVGMEDDAITTLQTALKYDPDDLEMGVDLARRYAEVGRVEASHNQIDRVLKKHKKSAKAHAFKAEVSEIAPQGWGFINHQAIKAWETVIELEDDAYDAIARQRLQDVYLEAFARYMRFGHLNGNEALRFAEEKLKKFPEFSLLRADYIAGLLSTQAKEKKVQQQLDLLDVKHERALHHLIDMSHIFERHDIAETMLKRAEADNTVDTTFYVGIAQCAIDREQIDIANTYFDRAMELAVDEEERINVKVNHATAYMTNGMIVEAEVILKEVLEDDPESPIANVTYAVIYVDRENNRKARQHLDRAEKSAKARNQQEVLAMVSRVRFQMDNPLASMLPPGFDPSMLPPGMDIEDLVNMMEMFGIDDDFDDDEDFF